MNTKEMEAGHIFAVYALLSRATGVLVAGIGLVHGSCGLLATDIVGCATKRLERLSTHIENGLLSSSDDGRKKDLLD